MRNYKDFQNILRTIGAYETVVIEGSKPPRIIWFNTVRYATTIIGLCARCVVYAMFGKFNCDKWAEFCYSSITFAEKIKGRLFFEGFKERSLYDGPVVYVSNHMSTLETMILPTTLLTFNELSIVLKNSLADNFFIGNAFRCLGCIGVTRKNAREDLQTVLKVGAQRLADGHSVLLFPEGTRQAVFNGKKFNSLGAKLAHRAGVPVVPIAVKTDFLGSGKIIKDFGEVNPNKPIHIACGPIISPELGAKEMHAKCVEFIDDRLNAWKEE
ncbi:MAG: lysophospholipid acyltransferase family protein [Kiritimatiellae bacterium]|jgi:1-acyl-sn-glycerol-3-phosphate acyltransferase|nr:lysophospholipid acyltransferase family protein [Kiritimatiellia bacterium]